MNTDSRSSPRVVYAGPLAGTCLSRLNALRKLAPYVVEFDTRPFFNDRTLLQKLDYVFTQSGAQFARANATFLELCGAAKPELIWMDKGFWVWPGTLEKLKSQGVFLVQHNTDALEPSGWLMRCSYRLLRKTLPLYDLYFTSNVPDHATLAQRSSGPDCELTFLGYDHELFNADPLPPEVAKEWANDLVFVGHHEPHTAAGIQALVDAGLQVRVVGANWERAKNRERLEGAVTFKMLDDADYIRALKGAKIGLCFFSKLNHNQTSGRSFEIPACGTFLLAMRSAQHRQCYEEGKEAEFFDSHEELVSKARHYLAHDSERREIARRGNERVVKSDYSWARYMRDDWNKTLAALNNYRRSKS